MYGTPSYQPHFKNENMRTVTHTLYLALFLCSLFLQGCIGEDNENCTDPYGGQELTLKFLHNINPDYANHLSGVLECIDLYIYNETGALLRREHLLKEELETTDYTYTTSLAAGRYKLVAWMNAGDAYTCTGDNDLESACLSVVCTGTELEIHENTPRIYYGYDDKLYDVSYDQQAIGVEIDRYPVHKDINFALNTNYIQIDANFDRILQEGTQVNVRIAGKNGACNFYNRCPPASDPYIYYPHKISTTYREVKYYYTHTSLITTQRLWQGDGLELVITKKDPGGYEVELARHPLTDGLIMRNPLYNNNYQLERYHTYHIVFDFDYERNSWVTTEITVDGWKLIHQNAEV